MSTPPTKPKLGQPKQGLSDLNQSLSAPRHKDLYAPPEDPAVERAELRHQARVLGLGFFVFFGLLITGLSFTFNHAWGAGQSAAFKSLSLETMPAWAPGDDKTPNAAALAWRASPPLLSTDRAVIGVPPTQLDLAFDEGDDVTPGEGQTPYKVFVEGRLVATAYYAAPSATETWIQLPNREPAPARSSFVHAYREARLLRLLPTRYVLYTGCVLGVLGLLVPGLLIPFYSFWMRYVTAPLGWFNTRVILTVLWVLIFTPTAILRRILSEDALRRAQLPPDQSYWLDRSPRDPKHFTHGF
ncbi:MAG: hypothetical protein JKY65_27695 [Planctomycetes bacterium]|nr:hypothetical protein [Planctomycetota bacterium]